MKKSVTNFLPRCIYSLLEYTILIVVFSCLVNLGNWQLKRATDKETILAQYNKMQASRAFDWTHKDKPPVSFAKVAVHGQLLKKLFFLDNQFYHHNLGYYLLVPVLLQDNSILMVDEGWLSANNNRHILPPVAVELQQVWSGQVYYPKNSKVKLGQVIDSRHGSSYVLESIDFAALEQILQRRVHHWVLRMPAGANQQFVREWRIVNMPPNRHRAYALQWFAMAGIIGIILLWRVGKMLNKKFKNYRGIIFLVIIFLLPFLAALFVCKHPSLWQGLATTNYGTWAPKIELPLQGKPWQIRLSTSACKTNCLKVVDKLARIRLAMGRKLYDVDIMVLIPKNATLPPQQKLKFDEWGVKYQPAPSNWDKNFSQLPVVLYGPEHTSILMYPLNFNAKQLHHDLQVLVK